MRSPLVPVFSRSDSPAAKRKIHIRGKVFNEQRISYLHTKSWAGATYNHSQGSSAFGVNEEQGRDREYHLNGTIAQRRVQGLSS